LQIAFAVRFAHDEAGVEIGAQPCIRAIAACEEERDRLSAQPPGDSQARILAEVDVEDRDLDRLAVEDLAGALDMRRGPDATSAEILEEVLDGQRDDHIILDQQHGETVQRLGNRVRLADAIRCTRGHAALDG